MMYRDCEAVFRRIDDCQAKHDALDWRDNYGRSLIKPNMAEGKPQNRLVAEQILARIKREY